MIQQTPVHERLKENAMKFDNLLRELDGMMFMDMKTKQFYEITGYQNSLRTDIKLELYSSQAESSDSEFLDSEFLYVVLKDSAVETALAAIYEHGLVPAVLVSIQEETENDESEEVCACPECAAENGPEKEPSNTFREILEIFNRMAREQ